jgi:Prasinovirus endonuclease VII
MPRLYAMPRRTEARTRNEMLVERTPICHPDRKHHAKGMCKTCYDTHWQRESGYQRRYRQKNKERIRIQQREADRRFYQRHKEQINCRERGSPTKRRYRERNRERIKEKGRQYYLANKEWIRARVKVWSKANRNRVRLNHNRWRSENSDRLRFRINLQQRMRSLIRGKVKAGRTAELLGCSIADFKIYIEGKFEPGMSWQNYGSGKGKWSVDHIVPCAIFDLSKSEHQRRCFHFSNLQPMWDLKNCDKSTKTDGQLRLV